MKAILMFVKRKLPMLMGVDFLGEIVAVGGVPHGDSYGVS